MVEKSGKKLREIIVEMCPEDTLFRGQGRM